VSLHGLRQPSFRMTSSCAEWEGILEEMAEAEKSSLRLVVNPSRYQASWLVAG
jgi:hypothetical protein